MSSFKQKLKDLLNDSSILKNPSNIDEKLGQLMIVAYRKIKRDNNVNSIYRNNRNNSSRNIKFQKNYFRQKSENFIKKQKKGISPKTAENMIKTLYLLKNQNSRNIYNESTYESINKYLNDSSITKQKIERKIDYFKKENPNFNHKYTICNRPITSFNKNKSVFNLKQIYKTKLNDLNKKNDDLFSDNDKDENILKKRNNVFNSFNKFIKKPKNKNYSYSRNNKFYKNFPIRFNF